MSPLPSQFKSLFATRTFWVNFITAAMAMVTGLAGAEWVQENPKLVSFLVGTVGMLNIVLRWVTSQPVTITGNPPSGSSLRALLCVALISLVAAAGCTAPEPAQPVGESAEVAAQFDAQVNALVDRIPLWIPLVGGLALGFFLARKFPNVFPSFGAPGPSVDDLASAVAKKLKA